MPYQISNVRDTIQLPEKVQNSFPLFWDCVLFHVSCHFFMKHLNIMGKFIFVG